MASPGCTVGSGEGARGYQSAWSRDKFGVFEPVRFNTDKGYGFISQEDGPDVFVHFTAIAREGYKNLEERQKVEFEVTEGPKGPQASSVRLID